MRPDPKHWTSLPLHEAYRSLFESEDSPLVQELRRAEKLLSDPHDAVVDPHLLGLARGVVRFATLVSPSHITTLAEANERRSDTEEPLTGRTGSVHRLATRMR